MRNNQPVTQSEFAVRSGSAIISHTDLKGLITFVNDDFIEASGFSREEVLGQPHNIVRHPDMPEAAFRDAWATIQAGRPWQGIVKNRCKDGGFYWVKATITPLPDNSGYMSVRVKPGREEIQQAEALFRQMKQNPSMTLREGQLLKPGLLGAIGRRLRGIRVSHLVWAQVVLILAVEAVASLVKSQGVLMFVEGGSLVLAVLLAWVIAGKVNKGFATANAMIASIAAGDLTRTLPPPGQDEIGEVLAGVTRMRNNLHGLVAALQQGVGKLTQAAEILDRDARLGAQATAEQSTAASSMAAAVEELSVSIDHVEESAGETRQIAESSGRSSAEGAEVIRKAGDEVGHLAEAVNESANTIRDLEAMSEKISSIVGVIGDIADQTNLLALNAAIEAARAGEQGRGFAVVADEVRKLAERTSNATGEITQTISQIQNGTQRAVQQMDASLGQVEQSVALAHQAGNAVGGIESASLNALRATDEIALALKEQSAAAREIARSVESIAQGTEASSALSAKTAELARGLNDLAGELKVQTSRFRVV
jgi:aerotaxis receptor